MNYISVLDYIPSALQADIRAGTSTTDVAQYFQQAAIAANFGQVSGEGRQGSVFVPNGTYRVDRVGIRDTIFIGESREGTVLKALTPGTNFMMDATLDRDGVNNNTRGRGWCESMTIDAANTGRSGLRVYGGGNRPANLHLMNAAVGLSAGLPIWSRFENIHSEKNGVGFFTYHAVQGDIGTSATFIDCWADTCSQYGFRITQLAYSSFISCVAQDCGTHNWFIDGNAGGVPAVYSLIFMTCASEGSGTPFYMKKVRDLTLLNPRIIGAPTVDYIVLDDAQGSIRDFSSVATPLPGKNHIRVENHTSGTGSILLDSSIVTYAPASDIYFTIQGGNTNGEKRAQQFVYRWNAITEAERMRTSIANVDGYAGLVLQDNAGNRVAAFRRVGTPIFATNGEIIQPGTNLTSGDVSFFADAAASTLRFTVNVNGVIKHGQVALS